MAKVKANRFFQGPSGSREKGDRFDYDIDKDPDGLVKLGYVDEVPASAEKPGK